MARRVGLPAPSLNPFGSGTSAFGEYDVLDEGREAAIAFQKAQAAWAAGKISDEAYLAAYEKYVNKLPNNSTQRINAQQSLDRERYTFKRNDIVARIESGDESAWNDLLAYDRASLRGMTPDNEEYQRRLGYLRSTQSSIFTLRYNEQKRKFSKGQMTRTQLRAWLQNARRTGLTDGNAALQREIGREIDSMSQDIAQERREETYRLWTEDKISPDEFMLYARQQLSQFKPGTQQYDTWKQRLTTARMQVAESKVLYRWQLSQQYHDNAVRLAQPPPGKPGSKTRTILRDGKWVEIPIDEAPNAADQTSYQQWQTEQKLLKAEQQRIERAMAAQGGGFVSPEQMIKWYSRQQQRVAKGTPQWLQYQENINKFTDLAAVWDAFSPENGYFPVVQQRATGKGSKIAGRRMPGEENITVATFMRALGSLYGGKKAQRDARTNQYGVTQEHWTAWASQYLGDAAARQTPENVEMVVRSRLTDLWLKYGSWALVANWWQNGAIAGESVADWSDGTRNFVDRMWQRMGLGPLPSQWTFDSSKYRIPTDTPTAPGRTGAAVGMGARYGAPRYGSGVPSAYSAGFNGWGARTDRGGGANLTDLSAGAAAYGIKLSDQNVSWEELKRRLARGESAVANGLMSEVRGTGLERWDVNFANKGTESRHSVHIIRYKNGKIFWQDPLRPEGSGKGQWVDEDVVLKFLLGFSRDRNDLGVAMSNQPVARIPQVVDEHEPGPWTGCGWASAAMLINGVKGRRVAEMEDVRWRGESGRWAGNAFNIPYGQATGTGGASSGGKAKPKNKWDHPYDPDKKRKVDVRSSIVPATDSANPTTPGPQAGPTTYQWGSPPAAGAAIGVGARNPNLTANRGERPAAREAGQFQYYAITGPPKSPGEKPRLAAVSGPEGMGVADFENFYQQAREAFINGETSFTFYDERGNLVNYFFSWKGRERLDQMVDLDAKRVALREHKWQQAEATYAADPTEAHMDALSEAREKHQFSLEDMGRNFITLLFQDDKVREEAGDTQAENLNPGADLERIGEVRADALQKHAENAQRWMDAGHLTQAWAEIQTANDIATAHGRDMDTLAQQLEQAVASVTAAGVAPTEEQRGDIEKAAAWRETTGFDKLTSDLESQLKELVKWVVIDPQSQDPVVGADGLLVMRPGTALVLKHNETGGSDKIVPTQMDVSGFEPGAEPGTMRPAPGIPGHVRGAVSVLGKTVVAYLPYIVGVVGVARTADGTDVPLMGKIINVNVEDRRQTVVENPFKPGQWSLTQDQNGDPLPLVFNAPADMTATANPETGDYLLSWAENGKTYTLDFDRKVNAYNVIEMPDVGSFEQQLFQQFSGEKPEPVVLGSLASSASLRDQLSQRFERDFMNVPVEQRAAAEMDALTVGLTPVQYGQQQTAERQRAQGQEMWAQLNMGWAARSARERAEFRANETGDWTGLYSYMPKPPTTPAPSSTPAPGTTTPTQVRDLAAERAKKATATATPTPTPAPTVSKPVTTTAPKPVATPAPKTTPAPTTTVLPNPLLGGTLGLGLGAPRATTTAPDPNKIGLTPIGGGR